MRFLLSESRSIDNRIRARADLHARRVAVANEQRSLLEAIERSVSLELWRVDGCRNPAQWVSAQLGISNWAASRLITSASALPRLPTIEAAFLAGEVSLDKVNELCRFVTSADEKRLLSWATRVSPAAIRRRADVETRTSLEDVVEADRTHYLNYWWLDEGRRFGLGGDFPADQGIVIAKALDRMAARLTSINDDDERGDSPAAPLEDPLDVRRADALYALASARIASDADADRATVVVHAPLEALTTGKPGCEIEDGPALHTQTVLRVACDCVLEVVLHNEVGEAVGIGRKERKVPRWMLRQLKHRDGRCTFPGCEAKHFLHAHHIHHWARGGRTDLDNLVLVCTFHHKLVHEYGWSVQLGAEPGTARWRRPGGELYEPGRAPPREPAISAA